MGGWGVVPYAPIHACNYETTIYCGTPFFFYDLLYNPHNPPKPHGRAEGVGVQRFTKWGFWRRGMGDMGVQILSTGTVLGVMGVRVEALADNPRGGGDDAEATAFGVGVVGVGDFEEEVTGGDADPGVEEASEAFCGGAFLVEFISGDGEVVEELGVELLECFEEFAEFATGERGKGGGPRGSGEVFTVLVVWVIDEFEEVSEVGDARVGLGGDGGEVEGVPEGELGDAADDAVEVGE